MNVRMPDGTLIRNVPPGTTKAQLLEKFSRYRSDRPFGTSEFAGLSPEERGELASSRLGTPQPSSFDIAKNVGLGALQAVGDIPAGLEQIAMRALPFPESIERASERRISEFERTKRGVLSRPGGQTGYLGGQLGMAFQPGMGAAKVAAGAGRLKTLAGTVGKPLAVGTGLTALQPHETEAARAKAVLESAAYGAAAGGAISGIGALGKGFKRAFTGGEPVEATGERAARAVTAQNKGYILTLGEISGNKRLQVLEDASENMLGGTAFAKIRAANKENTNKILSKRIGTETPELSSDWLAETSDDLGRLFEDVRALDDIAGAVPIGLSGVGPSLEAAVETGKLAGAKKIGNVVKEFRKRYKNEMTWNEYADLRSEWSQTVVGTQDRDFARRLGSLIGSLDDAAAKAAPDAAPLKNAAAKYREYLVIRDAVDENGDIIVGRFVGGVKKLKRGKYKTAKHGEDDLTDVARTLSTFKNQVPSSGTAERTQAMKTIAAAGRAPGILARGGAGYLIGDITGAGFGLAAPYLAQKALMSKTLRKYLEEQAPRTRESARGKSAEILSRAARFGAVLGGT